MRPDEIKRIRREAGLTQTELARVLGLSGNSSRYVRALETGEREPSGPVIQLLQMIESGELPDRYLAQANVEGGD